MNYPGTGGTMREEYCRRSTVQQGETTAAYNDDDELVLPVEAGEMWGFQFYATLSDSAVRVGLNGPAGCTVVSFCVRLRSATRTGSAICTAFGTGLNMSGGGDASACEIAIRGMVLVGVTAGYVKLAFGRDSADGTVNREVGGWVKGWRFVD